MYAAGPHDRQTPSRTRDAVALRRRHAFTLVELLVSIAILVLLTALVLAAFQRSDSDRLNASARLLQSYFEGARSRAISEDMLRGVRLIRRTSDRSVVDSVAYIGSPGFDTGTATVGEMTTSVTSGSLTRWRIENDVAAKWRRLAPKSATIPQGRDLIRSGLRIEIPVDSGSWYTVSSIDFDTEIDQNRFFIEGNYSGPTSGSIEYRLELAPTILPNTEPVQFDNGIVIDLDASQIPLSWRDDPLNAGTPAPAMDILFDSRGSPAGGTLAASGLVHLYVTTIADVELTRGQDPNHPRSGVATGPFSFPYVPAVVSAGAQVVPKTEPYVLSLFTQGGQVTTSQYNVTNTNGDPWADNPFSYARRGREAQ